MVFTDNREKYLGYGEAAAGLGLMIGPVIGGILNTYFSYMVTFFCFAGFCAVTGVLAQLMIPEILNKKFEVEEDMTTSKKL